MGLLDQIMGGGGGPQRQPGFGSTVAAGAVLALLVKAIRDHQAGQGPGERRSFDPNAAAGQGAGAPAPSGGGILSALAPGGLGALAGLAGSGGLGSLLGGLGGSGALGALISRFEQAGYGPQVSSWVGSGPNAPIQPNQVGEALGEGAVGELQQKTGLPRESLLSELAHVLPAAISQATPNGHAPNDAELHQAAGGR